MVKVNLTKEEKNNKNCEKIEDILKVKNIEKYIHYLRYIAKTITIDTSKFGKTNDEQIKYYTKQVKNKKLTKLKFSTILRYIRAFVNHNKKKIEELDSIEFPEKVKESKLYYDYKNLVHWNMFIEYNKNNIFPKNLKETIKTECYKEAIDTSKKRRKIKEELTYKKRKIKVFGEEVNIKTEAIVNHDFLTYFLKRAKRLERIKEKNSIKYFNKLLENLNNDEIPLHKYTEKTIIKYLKLIYSKYKDKFLKYKFIKLDFKPQNKNELFLFVGIKHWNLFLLDKQNFNAMKRDQTPYDENLAIKDNLENYIIETVQHIKTEKKSFGNKNIIYINEYIPTDQVNINLETLKSIEPKKVIKNKVEKKPSPSKKIIKNKYKIKEQQEEIRKVQKGKITQIKINQAENKQKIKDIEESLKFEDLPKNIKSCYAVIYSSTKKKILLGKKKKIGNNFYIPNNHNKWVIPGGDCKSKKTGKNIILGIMREFFEETGHNLSYSKFRIEVLDHFAVGFYDIKDNEEIYNKFKNKNISKIKQYAEYDELEKIQWFSLQKAIDQFENYFEFNDKLEIYNNKIMRKLSNLYYQRYSHHNYEENNKLNKCLKRFYTYKEYSREYLNDIKRKYKTYKKYKMENKYNVLEYILKNSNDKRWTINEKIKYLFENRFSYDDETCYDFNSCFVRSIYNASLIDWFIKIMKILTGDILNSNINEYNYNNQNLSKHSYIGIPPHKFNFVYECCKNFNYNNNKICLFGKKIVKPR